MKKEDCVKESSGTKPESEKKEVCQLTSATAYKRRIDIVDQEIQLANIIYERVLKEEKERV